jgi:hypothetical protein
LQGKGIEDIAEIRCTNRKIAIKDFVRGYGNVLTGKSEILIPEIDYITNDAWALASGSASGIPYPLLLRAKYASGYLYVLTIPENFGDIYNLPAEVLNQIRSALTRDLFVRLEGPAQVSLFVYDNRTFIVESFLPEATEVKTAVAGAGTKLRNLITDELLTGQPQPEGPWRGRLSGDEPRRMFSVRLPPHSYAVFKLEK